MLPKMDRTLAILESVIRNYTDNPIIYGACTLVRQLNISLSTEEV